MARGGREQQVTSRHLLTQTGQPLSSTFLPTHLRAAATALVPVPGGARPHTCPQHPTCETAETQQRHALLERAPLMAFTLHTETHRPGRHGVSTSTQRARTAGAPPRALPPPLLRSLLVRGSPAPPPSAQDRLPS